MSRPRRLWVVILLSLLVTGLGHLYLGAGRRGVVWFLVSVVLLLAVSLAYVTIHQPFGIVPIALLMAAFNLVLIVDGFRTLRRVRECFEPRWYNRWYVYLAVIVLAFVFVQFDSVIHKSYVVPSRSMESTILVGDRVVADMRAYHWRLPFGGPIVARRDAPKRGDVVVFTYPGEPDVVFVKRVIGLPGEVLEIRNTVLHVDGRIVLEPYARWDGRGEMDFGPYEVPAHRYFLMGDNRLMSLDSRQNGSVPESHILGRVFTIGWSLDPETGRLRWERFGQAF